MGKDVSRHSIPGCFLTEKIGTLRGVGTAATPVEWGQLVPTLSRDSWYRAAETTGTYVEWGQLVPTLSRDSWHLR